MIIYAVDDEPLALRLLENAINAVAPGQDVTCFSDPDHLLEAAQERPCDVAFLDIRMYGISGIEVARRLNGIQGARNIIFVTGYDSYAKDAFDVFASGYVLKPVCEEDVKKQLEHLRNPAPLQSAPQVVVQTFGSFDIFVDGVPVEFKRSKSKEILAFLVSRHGSRVSTDELVSVLWPEDEPIADRRGYVSVLLSELRKSLAKAGAEGVLRATKGGASVDPAAFDCDFYRLAEGDQDMARLFAGSFMSQYDWAQRLVPSVAELAKG